MDVVGHAGGRFIVAIGAYRPVIRSYCGPGGDASHDGHDQQHSPFHVVPSFFQLFS
jgi:hypothetical protein